MTVPRDDLAALLAGAASPAAFSASRSVPTSDLLLEVRGVGPIGLPVSPAQARQLCQVARPARYGHGELTILDRGIRDTWEIPKSRVKIDARRWSKTLRPALDRLGRDLGLPSGSELRAELHSMLVYARGQFFVQHQDSEKDDAMVASLVVGLPSNFKGGALEVRHGGKAATYRGSKQRCRSSPSTATAGTRSNRSRQVTASSSPTTSSCGAELLLCRAPGSTRSSSTTWRAASMSTSRHPRALIALSICSITSTRAAAWARRV